MGILKARLDLLEVSFHEILVQQLSYDPYKVDDTTKKMKLEMITMTCMNMKKVLIMMVNIKIIMAVILVLRHNFQLY